MDSRVLVTSFVSFILFLLSLTVLFRITRQEDAMQWIVRTWVAIACVIGVVCSQTVETLVFIVSIFTVLVMLFIFGIFSIMEASLTIRIFSEIAAAHEGMTIKKLLATYNRRVILKKRIARLIHSGELKVVPAGYAIGRISYFRIREYFLSIFRLAFG